MILHPNGNKPQKIIVFIGCSNWSVKAAVLWVTKLLKLCPIKIKSFTSHSYYKTNSLHIQVMYSDTLRDVTVSFCMFCMWKLLVLKYGLYFIAQYE